MIIYEDGSYRIKLMKKPDAAAVELLTATIWGTNGPLYQHLNTPVKIEHLSGPLSFTLEKHEKTIGTCSFLERTIDIENKKYKTWYSRYFAIDQDSQGKIFGNLLLKNIKLYFEKVTTQPTIFYAYVDQANPRSRKLLKHTGFDIIRNFETFVFSRVFPKKDERVTRIKEGEKEHVLTLLKEQYKEYSFVNFDTVFFEDNYFVLKEKGEIVAGLQANAVQWKVRYLPGVWGKIMINGLPYVPLISRLFNPKDFRFAGFEGIYCKKGYEKELFTLMESACSALNLYTGMLWMDSQSAMYDSLKNAGKWGLLNKIKDDVPAQVVVAFRNIPEKEQIVFRESPAYISACDLT